MKTTVIRIAVALLAVLLLCAFAACGEDGAVSPSDAISPTDEQLAADNEAAFNVFAAYFDAFTAKDVEALLAVTYSGAAEKLMVSNGNSRENLADSFQTNIDSMVERFGDFEIRYDRSTFSAADAEASVVDQYNVGFGLTEETGPVIDAVKMLTATVWVVNGDGEELEAEEGSMTFYRYDGEWYLYGN